VVNDLGDAPDANGDNICLTAESKCTLRAALQEANANVDANTITFSVTGTITPATALPDLSSGNITIAGANQTVTIDGSGLPGGTACLSLSSAGNAVKGIVIAMCAGDGIDLNGSGNVIGGTTSSDRNVIRDGAQEGISGCGSAVTGNQILGNYVGVNNTGNQAAQNNFGGVFLCYGASGNTIGGSSAGARNVISGHWNPGVRLMGAGPDNVVQGNYIGLDATGSFAIGNGTGVQMDEGASGNSVLDNVISGNNGAGVSVGDLFYSVSGSQTDIFASMNLDGVLKVNASQGVWETEQVNGTAPSWTFLSNKGDTLEITVSALDDGCGSVGPIWLHHFGTNEKVQITAGVANTCPGPGETVFFWSQPISIPAAPPVASGNVIQGNKIGTNPAGSAAIPNNEGVVVMGASSDTLIGGPSTGDGNLISGNWNAAIEASGSEATVIQGNLIGTDAGGSYAIGNGGLGGTVATGMDTVIGGTTAGERNVISGNSAGAILVDALDVNATITGNYIGTNAAGNSGVPNGGGVTVLSGGNVVGGKDPNTRNIIAHNNGPGLFLMWGGSQNNLVQGNWIIFNRSGVVITEGASQNTIEGNQISANWGGPGVSIGGLWYTLAGSDNVFGSLQLHGMLTVLVNGEQFDQYSTDGDEIGVQSLVANPGDQLELQLLGGSDGCGSVGPIWLQSYRTQEKIQLTPGIPESCPGAGVEVDSTTYSIEFPADELVSTGNVVSGNKIGTDPTGATAMGNSKDGVRIIGNSSQNEIGGTAPGQSNVIAFNQGDGVLVDGSDTLGNTIRGNSIHSNVGAGIALANGGNASLPAPVIASLGPVTGTACANCTVDVYSDSENEGRIYEGSTIANGSGNFTYSGAVSGPAVTATATDAAGNTSEFSDPLRLRLLGDVNGNGSVSMVDAMLIAQYVAGLIGSGALDLTAADVNCSGGATMVDAMLIAQKVAGLITNFPCYMVMPTRTPT
jgi:titin